MKNNDRLTSLFLAAVGLYVAFEGTRLGLGSLQKPRAGFLIFWVGIILSGLSLSLFLHTFSSPAEQKKYLWKGVQWPRGIKLTLALIAYVLVFKWLGFMLSTFFFLLFLFKGLEPQQWGVALVLSIVTTILCYLIFGLFLEVQFPEGILRGILGLF